MDYAVIAIYLAVALVVFGIIFRKEIRAWNIRRKLRAAGISSGTLEPPLLATRLYELDKIFAAFGSNAAHPSALRVQPQFVEAARLLALPSIPLAVVLQYVEGNSWSLAGAALAALQQRSDRGEAVARVLKQCAYFAPWTMYFALNLLFEAEPRIAVGAPLAYAKDWWTDGRWMANVFRDYLARCAERGDAATFAFTLGAPGSSPIPLVRQFLLTIDHPSATRLIEEIDAAAVSALPDVPMEDHGTLNAVGRFWSIDSAVDILVEPDGWREAFALARSTLRQQPPRSVLACGEARVGKTSFLRLLARQIAADGWKVFEASGADLQANQIYIGQLEGRIRQVVEELTRSSRIVWYIPDIVQFALSGTHSGQSATMLDQIMPAIAAGRLVVWAEATPKEAERLVRIKPALRGLFETVVLEALAPAQTLSLAHGVIREFDEKAAIRFDPECAEVALDTASQYLGAAGLPGSVLLMLKLTAVRSEADDGTIAARRVLETLSQLSGLPVSMLDTREQLDLGTVRDFFAARVMGQDEAVGAMVERVAMLKAGMNDPDKPIGVFLFAGPTGTGKTELAKAASEFLFGSVERMVRLDMSEFQTPESIGKILGQSAAGPIEADSLISRVRKQPFSVILLDEFEKAHPNIWDLFLQAFDEGRLTDAMGQAADLRHCLIIMTSNLGATAHRSLGLGFAPQADAFTSEQIMHAIEQTYRPEFRNRLDKIIVFRPLTRELMRGILKKELAGLLERRGLKDRAWAIEWESSALEFLLERGFSPEMGARPLKRAIDQFVVAPLAGIIVERRFPEGEQFLFVRSDGNGIQAEFVDPDADVAATDELVVAPTADAAASAIVAVILSPKGTQAEVQELHRAHEDIERTLASAEWQTLKNDLSDDMASPDFWNRPARYDVLARFALMDRVKAAAETAGALRRRLERYTRSPSRYSAELSARLALQLHLIREGIKDVFDNAPVEIALRIEPVFDGAGDRPATLAWCRRLGAMYRAWAAKRRMQLSEVSDAVQDKQAAMLVVSGFGAHRILSAEVGLHVLEPSEGPAGRVTARVSLAVVPLGDIPAVKQRALIVQAFGEAPRPNAVVRRYREQPPLVRDAAGGWRSGRLDAVMAGDFDLLQAGAR